MVCRFRQKLDDLSSALISKRIDALLTHGAYCLLDLENP